MWTAQLKSNVENRLLFVWHTLLLSLSIQMDKTEQSRLSRPVSHWHVYWKRTWCIFWGVSHNTWRPWHGLWSVTAVCSDVRGCDSNHHMMLSLDVGSGTAAVLPGNISHLLNYANDVLVTTCCLNVYVWNSALLKLNLNDVICASCSVSNSLIRQLFWLLISSTSLTVHINLVQHNSFFIGMAALQRFGKCTVCCATEFS